MKMEMSYRDKVILIVLLIVIIIVAGIMALIKPKYESYTAAKAAYATTLEKWEGVEEKINAIEPLKNDITATYNDSMKDAAVFKNNAFVNVHDTLANEKTAYEIDKYLQPLIDEFSLNVTGMELDAVSAEAMTYYYYTPNVLTYSLLEAADINGTYAAKIADGLKASTVLSQRSIVEVMNEDVTLTVEGEKENVLNFLNKIAADENAVLVKSVSIADYQFLGGLEKETLGPDGQPIVTIDPNGVGTSEVTIVIGFYNAKEMEKPVFEN